MVRLLNKNKSAKVNCLGKLCSVQKTQRMSEEKIDGDRKRESERIGI